MPQFSYRDIIQKVKKKGFVFFREAKGSHEIWINNDGVKVTIPKHKVIATGTVHNICKQIGFKHLKEFEQFS